MTEPPAKISRVAPRTPTSLGASRQLQSRRRGIRRVRAPAARARRRSGRCRLQHVGLVGAAAGAHAERGGVDAERGQWSSDRGHRQRRNRHGAAQCAENDEAAAVDVHGAAPMRFRTEHFKSRARNAVPRSGQNARRKTGLTAQACRNENGWVFRTAVPGRRRACVAERVGGPFCGGTSDPSRIRAASRLPSRHSHLAAAAARRCRRAAATTLGMTAHAAMRPRRARRSRKLSAAAQSNGGDPLADIDLHAILQRLAWSLRFSESMKCAE